MLGVIVLSFILISLKQGTQLTIPTNHDIECLLWQLLVAYSSMHLS